MIPDEIIVDSRNETRSFFVSPELDAAGPGLLNAFARAESAYLKDPEAYLTWLQESVFSFKSKTGVDINCSLLFDDTSKKDELLVVWAPFLDQAPKNDASQVHHYISNNLGGGLKGLFDKEKAQISSWMQTTRSSDIFELLKALDSGLPVLTIYSPIPPGAYARWERDLFQEGHFSPAAGIAKQAIDIAQQRLHGAHSETRIDKAHQNGASLGASNAIGAGKGLLEKDIAVPTVSAQELILIPKQQNRLAELWEVLKRYSFASEVGEPSDVELPKDLPRIYEPQIKKDIDRHGSELSMYIRMPLAARPTYLVGFSPPEPTVKDMETLLDNNVAVLVAVAENSAPTKQTKDFLPKAGEKVITIRGEKGQMASHLVNENVAVTGLVAALGIRQR